MAEMADMKEELIRESEANAAWLAVVSGVMDGHIEPADGVARLRTLASQYPCDAAWLTEEAETIRWTFGMDVEEAVDRGDGYWDEVLAVAEGLLDERVVPRQAVYLLERVRAQFPEQAAHAQRLIDDIVRSPLWQIVDAGA